MLGKKAERSLQKEKRSSQKERLSPQKQTFSSRQVNAIVLAEGVARFCVLLPILTTGVWRGRGLGIFTAACLAGCLVTGLLERCMWAEDTFFHTLFYTQGRRLTLVSYAAVFWFFLAQIPVMLRMASEIMLYYIKLVPADGILKYSFFFLPFLISSALNAFFYMRRIYLRLYGEGIGCCGALQRTWILRIRDWIWWVLVLAACALAAGFRDRYAMAGFYCAYNWQLMVCVFLLLWIFSVFRKKKGKRDCGY
ncbi:MAG: hypothetical protein Q4C61_00265 [Lachnospiraceae bacterium]|nr:hypothetical protein [Lachnospiraceae bacterium]